MDCFRACRIQLDLRSLTRLKACFIVGIETTPVQAKFPVGLEGLHSERVPMTVCTWHSLSRCHQLKALSCRIVAVPGVAPQSLKLDTVMLHPSADPACIDWCLQVLKSAGTAALRLEDCTLLMQPRFHGLQLAILSVKSYDYGAVKNLVISRLLVKEVQGPCVELPSSVTEARLSCRGSDLTVDVSDCPNIRKLHLAMDTGHSLTLTHPSPLQFISAQTVAGRQVFSFAAQEGKRASY